MKKQEFMLVSVLIVSIMAAIIAMTSLLTVLYGKSACSFLPMNNSQEWKMSHITPNEPSVEEIAEYYDSPELIQNFIEERYVYTRENYDVWMFPEEVLKVYKETGWLKGDCEDIAFLEVSLFRAIDMSEEQVRVVIFRYPAGGMERTHAGVEIWRNGEWRLLRLYDPQGVETEQILYPEEKRLFAFNDKLWWEG